MLPLLHLRPKKWVVRGEVTCAHHSLRERERLAITQDTLDLIICGIPGDDPPLVGEPLPLHGAHLARRQMLGARVLDASRHCSRKPARNSSGGAVY